MAKLKGAIEEEEEEASPAQCNRERTKGKGVLSPDVSISSLPFNPLSTRELASVSSAELCGKQQENASLKPLFARVGEERSIGGSKKHFMLVANVLDRRWARKDIQADICVGDVVQDVVPKEYWESLEQLAHEGRLAGHLGVKKTVQRLRQNFLWPNMTAQVTAYIRVCHTCQLVDKPNQVISVAPLLPIPAVEPPFTTIMIDIVRPLPPSWAGNKYLLTIMDVTTRYPKAIPMRSMHAKPVVKHLICCLYSLWVA